jgi:hypothetical protein
MGRRAVKASGTARFESQGLFNANSNYAYKGYLSSDTVNQARNLLTLDVSGPVTANNGTTNNGAKLIDMINAISSSVTKTVEIESRWVVFSSTRMNGDVLSLVVHFSIFIDWVHMTADWVYTWGPSVGSGHVQLDDVGNNVSMVASSNGAQVYLSFRTGPAKEILSIPLPFSINSVFSTSNYGSWSIITDDGTTVVAAPEPPAADVVTVTQEVSGIKISELNAADSLNDTDLFVLSRDDPAGGPYDESRNITKADLFQEIVTQTSAPVFLESKVALENGGTSLSLTAYDLTSPAYGNVPVGAKFAILESFWHVSGPDSGGIRYLHMGPGPTTADTTYVLGAIFAAGNGDSIAGANQAICPIKDGKIYMYLSGSFYGNFYVNIIGYFS